MAYSFTAKIGPLLQTVRNGQCKFLGLIPESKYFSLIRQHARNHATGKASEWKKVMSDAEKIVGYSTSFLNLRCIWSDELSNVALQMRKLVGSNHPILQTAKDLICDKKHTLQTRGLIVLLVSKAAGSAPDADHLEQDQIGGIYQSQRSLAELTEIIHTADLIHKGVVNITDLLPIHGSPADMEFGNKMAVLSGDFLLAKVSMGLADMRNPKVVESMVAAIRDMMESEFTGFTDKHGSPALPVSCRLSDWFQQTFLSSGSLLARSCESAMKLANHGVEVQQQAFDYGLNTAYVQQLSEDVHSFTQGDHNDIRITSAPVVLLQELQPEVVRSICQDENLDRKKLKALVVSSGVLQQCRKVCDEYTERAINALTIFPSCDAKSALLNFVYAFQQGSR